LAPKVSTKHQGILTPTSTKSIGNEVQEK